MIETEFLEIQSKLGNYKYSSMQYLEYSEVLQYELILMREECILLYGFNEKEGCHEYHFAANTPEIILNKARNNACLITFVPEEWITEFEEAGFEVCAAFCDYFMESLEDVSECGEPEFLKEDECKEAADVTIVCKGQSRGFHGETPEWIREWITTFKDTDDDLEYLHRAILIKRNEQAEIVGIVVTGLYGFESEKGTVSWIREVAVKPEYQQRGIARKLITQALYYGKSHGSKRAFLAADACNIHAIHLYESIGFRAGKDKQINMIKEV